MHANISRGKNREIAHSSDRTTLKINIINSDQYPCQLDQRRGQLPCWSARGGRGGRSGGRGGGGGGGRGGQAKSSITDMKYPVDPWFQRPFYQVQL